MFICLNVILIFVIGIFIFVSKCFIDGICVVALAPIARTISGATVEIDGLSTFGHRVKQP